VAEHEYTVETRLPVDEIWEFVEEMDNWAAYLTGYQSHEKQSEEESLWTLKGDVGVLTRTLRFRVRVTEWAGPERVRFRLEGLNEPMRGEGAFTMSATRTPPASAPAQRRGALARAWEWLVRRLFRRVRGATPAPGRRAPGAVEARLTFWLRIEPGGPMAPMIDAMMRPAMAAAAEDLAERIVAEVERRR
jgi:carbon monoxide dehydrogenase subunit G